MIIPNDVKSLNFVLFRYNSETKDFRNQAFGTAKFNKVACEFLGSRNFALEGKVGVYKNADHKVN